MEKYLIEGGIKIITYEQWLQTDLQKDIWNNKYRYNSESFEEFFNRVADNNDNIKQLMFNKKFLPAGRILANRGLYKDGRKVTYSNCYVASPPEDNIESIFECATKIARTYSYGGGIGIDISKLSPRGAKINNAAKETTGSVSFMELYSLVTGLIGQEGRRGALMISLDCAHPDLEEFINIKNDLNKINKANISIRISDKFMQAVKEDKSFELYYYREQTNEEIKKTVNAKDLFRMIAENNWRMAEPGFLMWDRINSWNLLSEDKNFAYAGVNPCQPFGEYVLTPNGYIKYENINDIITLKGKNYKSTSPFYTGEKEVYEVALENGISVRMTNNHKVSTIKGDTELNNLKIGDKVKVDYSPIYDTKIVDVEEYNKGIIAGWFIADGGFMQHHNNDDYMIFYSVGDKEFEYEKILEQHIQKFIDENFKFEVHAQKNTCKFGRVYKQELVDNFKKDILQINSWNKFDINLDNRTKEFKLGFIRGLFTCDGCSRTHEYAILNSINKEFLKNIQRILMEFGVYSTVTRHNHARNYIATDNKERNNKEQWKVGIYDTEFIKIGFLTDYKQDVLIKKYKKNSDKILSKKQFLKIRSIDYIGILPVYDINVDEVHHYNTNGIVVHNCAEECLPAGGSCLLGSFNLAEYVLNPFTINAKFDFDTFSNDIKTVVAYMNEILDEGLPLHPLQEQKDSVRDWRQVGIGYMGLGDMLIKMGIKYGNPESIILSDQIGFCLINNSIKESALLAKEQGTYPKYNAEAILNSPFFVTNTNDETKEIVKLYGLRNSQLLTCAPTGTLSTMLGISGGLEPIFELCYNRKTESLHGEDKIYKVYTPIVKEYMEKFNFTDESELPDYFVTAMSLDYKDRIAMQAIWQKHIDASISSTVNVPEEFAIEQVEDLYMKAWEMGLKGVTIFRNNCERVGILTTEKDEDDIEYILERGSIIQTSDDLIGRKRKAMTGCGSLHIQAYFDPGTGELMEVFLDKGSSGGCAGYMVGLSRLISLSARGGIPLESILDQLNSVPACPSYVARTISKQDTSKGNCCPIAISKKLIEMQKEIWDQLGIEEDLVVDVCQDKTVKIKTIKYHCPECGEELRFEGGCNTCPSCGYSKCS